MEYISPEDYWGRRYPDPIPPPELFLESDNEIRSSEDIDSVKKSCLSKIIQELIRILNKYTCDCRRTHTDLEHKME